MTGQHDTAGDADEATDGAQATDGARATGDEQPTDGERATGDLAIEVPAESPNEEQVAVRVTGAGPGETVTLTATLTDDDGDEWRSTATFVATDAGVVDLTEHAPESGSYDGVAPMGWLWSMATDAEAMAPALGDPRFRVDLAAETDGDRAATTVERVQYDAGVVERPVDADDVAGRLFEPPGEEPRPGVLLLHGSDGRLPDRTARVLASHGYAVLTPRYHGDPDPVPDEHVRVPLSSLDAAADWLRSRPGVRDGPVGAMGGSRGGELALLLGARRDWVGAVVSLAGSAVAWDTPSDEPAWVDDGEPVPHLAGKPVPRETTADGLDGEPVDEAAIAVEATDGPVFMASGGDDPVWDAPLLCAVAVERLERADFEYRYDHRVYEDAGHLFAPPYVPTTGFVRAGGTPRANAEAGADAWDTTLATLARGLRSDGD